MQSIAEYFVITYKFSKCFLHILYIVISLFLLTDVSHKRVGVSGVYASRIGASTAREGFIFSIIFSSQFIIFQLL